jgi:hypothetical protein
MTRSTDLGILSTAETLWVWRRRAGLTQFEAAKRFSLTLCSPGPLAVASCVAWPGDVMARLCV